MKTVAFIGSGVMGRRMAGNVLRAGYALRVYDPFKDSTKELVENGALYCETPAEAAQGAEAVVTIVGFPKDVESVYFGENGLLGAAAPGTLLIDMTTSTPALDVRIAEAADKLGLPTLDAPVTGGPSGAQDGTLSIMVGGEKDVFQKALPLLSLMGKTVTYTGPHGNGQHAKMANQILVACNITAAAEALAYAKAVGLDPEIMLKCTGAGAGGSWQLTNMTPRMITGDDGPYFMIKHMIKDMNITVEEAEARGLELASLSMVRGMFIELADKGLGACGTQAICHYYDK